MNLINAILAAAIVTLVKKNLSSKRREKSAVLKLNVLKNTSFQSHLKVIYFTISFAYSNEVKITIVSTADQSHSESQPGEELQQNWKWSD